jgi:hypothetical protein
MKGTSEMMNATAYETCKVFEIPSDFQTMIRTEVSAKPSDGKRFYRIATHRVYQAPDGTERRSAWFGIRDIPLKEHLEREALDWVSAEIQAHKQTTAAEDGRASA